MWIEINENRPPLNVLLLLHIEEDPSMGLPSCVVLGYFKTGSNNHLYYVHPGVGIPLYRKVTHWCDCLGREFSVPGWPGTPFKN